jgi:hypothetical protein
VKTLMPFFMRFSLWVVVLDWSWDQNGGSS